jgi:thymidylate synthase (FAD)
LYNNSKARGYVELIDLSTANQSLETGKRTVADIASLAYGKSKAKNPEKLFQSLLDKGHTSVLEFIRDPGLAALQYALSNKQAITYNQAISLMVSPSPRDTRNINARAAGFPNREDFYEMNKEALSLFDFDIDAYLTETHKVFTACFKVKAPIFVARQVMRHRSFSFLEMSRRYVNPSSVKFDFWDPANVIDAKQITETYYDLRNKGHKPEVARAILPLCTYTTFYVCGEIYGLANFMKLRLAKEAQPETRELARAMMQLLMYEHKTMAKQFILPHLGEEHGA